MKGLLLYREYRAFLNKIAQRHVEEYQKIHCIGVAILESRLMKCILGRERSDAQIVHKAVA